MSLVADLENLTKSRRGAMGSDPSELTEIYKEEVNIAVWQRDLSERLLSAVDELLEIHPSLELAMNAKVKDVPIHLSELFGDLKMNRAKASLLVEDMANVVNMFCCLFELPRVGLRLTALNRAMCPRFHVDQIPARLATTYRGSATQWLPHHRVDRRMLGMGSAGLTDDASGLYMLERDIEQLTAGDIAIMKGELWEGNEQAGLVHRSPAVGTGDLRLLMTLDFAN